MRSSCWVFAKNMMGKNNNVVEKKREIYVNLNTKIIKAEEEQCKE